MWFDLNIFIYSGILILLFIILSLSSIIFVALFTLLERLILASTQIRKGPNLVGFLGLAQPFADAIKLLFKELLIPKKSNTLIFIIGPAIMLYISLISWFMLPLSFTAFIMLPDLMFLYIFVFSSINAITVILIGWSSNSKYAFQGAMRSISQMISYELPFSLILLNMILIYGSLEITTVITAQMYSWGILNIFSFILFFISALGETNRTPFDLAEAESELVSGYNTEHGSVLFTYIFLAEYCYIVIISNIIVILFFGGWLPLLYINLSPWLNYVIKLFFCLYLFVWVRATLPRFRYDQLMYLGWLILLPMVIGNLVLDFGFLAIYSAFPFFKTFW